tara:strand:- start:2180 stop:2671 length:492 start_codon:yes stop_codon:yes gene_type:complete
MKRNFGIGEKEEASPGKVIPPAEVSSKTYGDAKKESDEEKKTKREDKSGKSKVPQEKSKGVLGQILSGVGASLQAGIDAGAGTSYGADKEAKMEAAEKKKQKLANDELLHKRAMELMSANKKTKLPGDTNGDGIVDAKDTKIDEEEKGEGTGEEEKGEEENGE